MGQGCPRCRAGHKGASRRTREQERGRFTANPWRRQYDTAEYRKARQLAIERQGGLCTACKRQVAVRKPNGHWAVRGGGVHHIRPLSQGGGNGAGNLVLLCTACHNRIEAERRAS